MDTIEKKKIRSWAHEFKGKFQLNYPKNIDEIKSCLNEENEIIPSGGFRSYGDSAISENIISSKYLNKIIKFEDSLGILKVQSGVTIDQMINFLIERGWFLKVSPGTKFATLGGCIASDVHGKEHHKEGCFSESVLKIKMLINKNQIIEFTKDSHPDLFKATCGGMGLTGFIIEAEIKCNMHICIYVYT